MKRVQISLLSLIVISLVFTGSTLAQSKSARVPKTEGVFYRVSGKGLKKPSYILGTFHIICPSDMFSLDKVHSYVDQTDNIVLEIEMDNKAEMAKMSSGITLPAGKSLTDYLTPEQYAKVDTLVKNTIGVSADQIKQIKPVYISVLIMTSPKNMGCTPSSYETDLVQYAVTKKRDIVGLETVESQIAVLDKMPIEKQAKNLYETAVDPEKSLNDLKKLMDAYKSQNLDRLYKESIRQSDMAPEFEADMLTNRNKDWIPKFIEAMTKDSTFFAVGAAHLAGKDGVVQLLRKKGYDVESLKF